jgi:hypothetical protein
MRCSFLKQDWQAKELIRYELPALSVQTDIYIDPLLKLPCCTTTNELHCALFYEA